MTTTYPEEYEPGKPLRPGTLLTPDALARRRGVSPGHLANLRSSGEGLPYIKIGNRIAYRSEDILAQEEASLVMPARGVGDVAS